MGIYIFKWRRAERVPHPGRGRTHSENDFGKNVIPCHFLNDGHSLAYDFQGYWKDVGTIELPVGGQYGPAGQEARLQSLR